MNIKVNAHKIKIEPTPVNEKEVNITKCYFEFAEEMQDLVKEAYFTLNNQTYKVIIQNNECDIPSEVLVENGVIEIGVVCFEVQDEQTIKRYNPSPDYFRSWVGSLKEADNTEPITPTDKEQIEQQLQNISNEMDNLDIEAQKVDHTTTITVTRKDGTSYEVEVLDGEKGEKGDKGDAGSIKFIIVDTLPTENIDESAIYLTPSENPDLKNYYDEWIWVVDRFEPLGETQIEVDLTDYVKNTDYATENKGGTIKTSNYYATNIYNGVLYARTKTYSDYTGGDNSMFIGKGTLENVIAGKGLVSNTNYATSSVAGVIKAVGSMGFDVSSTGVLQSKVVNYENYESASNYYNISKGTLENVITGKGLTTKSYVDGLVGDIGTALDTINGEVI